MAVTKDTKNHEGEKTEAGNLDPARNGSDEEGSDRKTQKERGHDDIHNDTLALEFDLLFHLRENALRVLSFKLLLNIYLHSTNVDFEFRRD